ncbi:uncharacterized protein LOC111047127 [Nilaparvata lugens]|uniref:uncharacterized protein LOC111047127 n=1 Tax=Nilaparvata lugens TaxID=108931 RepID=UPI00193E06E8|nr:uncharacterized protein LOC111047127 [Nilaparvata lugens]
MYRSVVKLAMLYGAETWPVSVKVAEMCGVTRRDRIRNELIRSTVGVGQFGRKMQEARMRWFGHVQRREEDNVGQRVQDLDLGGRRGRERPRMRWRDSVEADLPEKGWRQGEEMDRILWRMRLKEGNADSI